MNIDKELLDILACPKCKGGVRIESDGAWIVCDACRVKYPVRDDIPAMLIEEAKPLEAAG